MCQVMRVQYKILKKNLALVAFMHPNHGYEITDIGQIDILALQNFFG